MLKHTFLVTILGATLSCLDLGAGTDSSTSMVGSGSSTVADLSGSKGMKTGSGPKASDSFL